MFQVVSHLLQSTLTQRSWSWIPSPLELPDHIKLKRLQDPRIEIFNACFRSPDEAPDEKIFTQAVSKILRLFDRSETRGLIQKEGLLDIDPESDGLSYGNHTTLKDFLTHNASSPRFAHRVIRIADMLDDEFKKDQHQAAAQLASWAIGGLHCRTRSEKETDEYYLAHIIDPDRESGDLSKDYWTLELRVALSLAKLREQLLEELVPHGEKERVHQVAYLKKKGRRLLSLIGDAENYQDTLEFISVQDQYKQMGSEEIVGRVLEKYTPDRMAQHIAQEIDKDKDSLLPYEKLFRRFRFQFLRDSIDPTGRLDNSLFKDEDFILSDACNAHYMETHLSLYRSFQQTQQFPDWQALKGKSFEVAKDRLEHEFYDEYQMHFTPKGAKALLYGMDYLEEMGEYAK